MILESLEELAEIRIRLEVVEVIVDPEEDDSSGFGAQIRILEPLDQLLRQLLGRVQEGAGGEEEVLDVGGIDGAVVGDEVVGESLRRTANDDLALPV